MKIKQNILIFTIFFLFSFLLKSQDTEHFKSLEDKVNYYKQRYKAECVSDKITDNHGDGFEALYGTRNMRTILFGVAYRGGANNFFHKQNKRDNHNPLPEDGLINLSEEGFSTAIYLYSTNFADAPKSCKNNTNDNNLSYIQNSGNTRPELRKLMLMVKDVIDNPQKGPVYLHCWNGWHQSGYVSAAILMQFCKFSNQEAFDYWMKNTDGVNKGYENVKKKVKNFKAFDDIEINDSIRKAICPCNK